MGDNPPLAHNMSTHFGGLGLFSGRRNRYTPTLPSFDPQHFSIRAYGSRSEALAYVFAAWLIGDFPKICSKITANDVIQVHKYFDGTDIAQMGFEFLKAVLLRLYWSNNEYEEKIMDFLCDWTAQNPEGHRFFLATDIFPWNEGDKEIWGRQFLCDAHKQALAQKYLWILRLDRRLRSPINRKSPPPGNQPVVCHTASLSPITSLVEPDTTKGTSAALGKTGSHNHDNLKDTPRSSNTANSPSEPVICHTASLPPLTGEVAPIKQAKKYTPDTSKDDSVQSKAKTGTDWASMVEMQDEPDDTSLAVTGLGATKPAEGKGEVMPTINESPLDEEVYTTLEQNAEPVKPPAVTQSFPAGPRTQSTRRPSITDCAPETRRRSFDKLAKHFLHKSQESSGPSELEDTSAVKHVSKQSISSNKSQGPTNTLTNALEIDPAILAAGIGGEQRTSPEHTAETHRRKSNESLSSLMGQDSAIAAAGLDGQSRVSPDIDSSRPQQSFPPNIPDPHTDPGFYGAPYPRRARSSQPDYFEYSSRSSSRGPWRQSNNNNNNTGRRRVNSFRSRQPYPSNEPQQWSQIGPPIPPMGSGGAAMPQIQGQYPGWAYPQMPNPQLPTVNQPCLPNMGDSTISSPHITMGPATSYPPYISPNQYQAEPQSGSGNPQNSFTENIPKARSSSRYGEGFGYPPVIDESRRYNRFTQHSARPPSSYIANDHSAWDSSSPTDPKTMASEHSLASSSQARRQSVDSSRWPASKPKTGAKNGGRRISPETHLPHKKDYGQPDEQRSERRRRPSHLNPVMGLDMKKLHVSGLGLTDSSLALIFDPFKCVHIGPVINSKTHRTPFCFVSFETPAHAQHAMSILHNRKLDNGGRLKVNQAYLRESDVETLAVSTDGVAKPVASTPLAESNTQPRTNEELSGPSAQPSEDPTIEHTTTAAKPEAARPSGSGSTSEEKTQQAPASQSSAQTGTIATAPNKPSPLKLKPAPPPAIPSPKHLFSKEAEERRRSSAALKDIGKHSQDKPSEAKTTSATSSQASIAPNTDEKHPSEYGSASSRAVTRFASPETTGEVSSVPSAEPKADKVKPEMVVKEDATQGTVNEPTTSQKKGKKSKASKSKTAKGKAKELWAVDGAQDSIESQPDETNDQKALEVVTKPGVASLGNAQGQQTSGPDQTSKPHDDDDEEFVETASADTSAEDFQDTIEEMPPPEDVDSVSFVDDRSSTIIGDDDVQDDEAELPKTHEDTPARGLGEMEEQTTPRPKDLQQSATPDAPTDATPGSGATSKKNKKKKNKSKNKGKGKQPAIESEPETPVAESSKSATPSVSSTPMPRSRLASRAKSSITGVQETYATSLEDALAQAAAAGVKTDGSKKTHTLIAYRDEPEASGSSSKQASANDAGIPETSPQTPQKIFTKEADIPEASQQPQKPPESSQEPPEEPEGPVPEPLNKKERAVLERLDREGPPFPDAYSRGAIHMPGNWHPLATGPDYVPDEEHLPSEFKARTPYPRMARTEGPAPPTNDYENMTSDEGIRAYYKMKDRLFEPFAHLGLYFSPEDCLKEKRPQKHEIVDLTKDEPESKGQAHSASSASSSTDPSAPSSSIAANASDSPTATTSTKACTSSTDKETEANPKEPTSASTTTSDKATEAHPEPTSSPKTTTDKPSTALPYPPSNPSPSPSPANPELPTKESPEASSSSFTDPNPKLTPTSTPSSTKSSRQPSPSQPHKSRPISPAIPPKAVADEGEKEEDLAASAASLSNAIGATVSVRGRRESQRERERKERMRRESAESGKSIKSVKSRKGSVSVSVKSENGSDGEEEEGEGFVSAGEDVGEGKDKESGKGKGKEKESGEASTATASPTAPVTDDEGESKEKEKEKVWGSLRGGMMFSDIVKGGQSGNHAVGKTSGDGQEQNGLGGREQHGHAKKESVWGLPLGQDVWGIKE